MTADFLLFAAGILTLAGILAYAADRENRVPDSDDFEGDEEL